MKKQTEELTRRPENIIRRVEEDPGRKYIIYCREIKQNKY